MSLLIKQNRIEDTVNGNYSFSNIGLFDGDAFKKNRIIKKQNGQEINTDLELRTFENFVTGDYIKYNNITYEIVMSEYHDTERNIYFCKGEPI